MLLTRTAPGLQGRSEGRMGGVVLGQGGLAGHGDTVEASAGTMLIGGELGVLPKAFKEACLLQPAQGFVEGTVGGEEPGVSAVPHLFGEEEAVGGVKTTEVQV